MLKRFLKTAHFWNLPPKVFFKGVKKGISKKKMKSAVSDFDRRQGLTAHFSKEKYLRASKILLLF